METVLPYFYRVTNDGDHLPDIVSDKTELEKQVEASAEELERLLLEGKELVLLCKINLVLILKH